MMKKLITAILCVAVGSFFCPIQLTASPHYETNTLYEIEVTAYCETGTTSSGYVIPSDGTGKMVCAFGKEYEGMTACIYYDDELVGIYEILDTGSVKAGITTSEVLDINIPGDKQACKEWGRRKCMVYFMKGVG